MRSKQHSVAQYGWLGLLLIALAWPISWLQPIPRATAYVFFFQWLGYILVVDALVLKRRGTSLLARDRAGFAGMFLVSAPIWWVFEFVNRFVQNWHYVGRETFTDLEYFLLASFSFSTVVPAVFESAELISTLGFVQRFANGWRISPTPRLLTGWITFSLLAFAAIVLLPRYTFPLAWLFMFFLLDPINHLSGRPSILAYLSRGDWRVVVALALGTLLTGFFWEFWNFYAHPKWIYTIPFVGFWKIFEMPLLGYGGYLPFGLEIFAMYHFLTGLTDFDGSRCRAGVGVFGPEETGRNLGAHRRIQ